jgi:hypothetical protein
MQFTNYEFTQGQDVMLNFSVKQSDGTTAQDIGDWVFLMTLKESKIQGDNDTGVVKIAGTITGDGSTGLFTMAIPHATTKDLSGTYYYDVKAIDDSGNVKPIFIAGVMTFNEAVTQRSA